MTLRKQQNGSSGGLGPDAPSASAGFRFSVSDAGVLAGGLAATIWLKNRDFPLWWVVPAAVGHFFLFCNVFLVWRRWEMIWAAVFVLNVAGHLAVGIFDWPSPLALQFPVTVTVIVLQIRSPWYRGIFAKERNPPILSSQDE